MLKLDIFWKWEIKIEIIVFKFSNNERKILKEEAIR